MKTLWGNFNAKLKVLNKDSKRHNQCFKWLYSEEASQAGAAVIKIMIKACSDVLEETLP